MRIGINVPYRDKAGKLLDAAGIAERARMIEAAGLDGIWVADHLTTGRPDILPYLTIAGLATEHVELGTCIYIVPLRYRFDLAQRFYTLETLAPGRTTLGVGTGSAEREFDLAEVSFADRFKLMRRDMDDIRKATTGKPNAFGPQDEGQWSWGGESGAPRYVLGAWHSEPQLRRAAAEYDGWMSSAGGGTRIGGWRIMGEAIKRYRDLGGKRAMIASVNVDLKAETTPQGDEDPFFLQCSPEAATERLQYLESLGYDDVILHYVDHTSTVRGGMGFIADFTMDDLEEIRSLMPRDTRDYHTV